MSQMVEHEVITDRSETSDKSTRRSGRIVAAGSVFGALIASSCCILPLLLVTLGISGAWIGNLTALEPYKPYFLLVTVVLLGAGFWLVYIKPKKACAEGAYCARPVSAGVTKLALWIAAILVLLSATIGLWAPLFY